MDEPLYFFPLERQLLSSCHKQLPPSVSEASPTTRTKTMAWFYCERRPKARTRPGGKHGKSNYWFQLSWQLSFPAPMESPTHALAGESFFGMFSLRMQARPLQAAMQSSCLGKETAFLQSRV